MASKKVGVLVKEARTGAGLTQEKLAKAAGEGLSAADIGKCERGEADLTTAQLKKIAIACGVTQKSLVEAPKNLKTTAAKTSSAKTASSAKADGKTASSKTGTVRKTEKKAAVPAGANVSMKVTATEKKLIEAYREAPSDLKKASLKLLKGEYGDTINKLLGASSASGSDAADGIGEMLGGLLGNLLGGK